jgi:hypothetical protein
MAAAAAVATRFTLNTLMIRLLRACSSLHPEPLARIK